MHTHTTPARRGALTTALLLAALIMLTAALPAAASAQVRSVTRTFAPPTRAAVAGAALATHAA